MSLKQQFGRAQQYIKAGDYDKARKILTQIDHPKATEWIMKIDRISPKAKPKAPMWPWLAAGAAIILVGVIAVGLILTNQDGGMSVTAQMTATAEYEDREIDAWAKIVVVLQEEIGAEEDSAREIAGRVMVLYPNETIACTEDYDWLTEQLSYISCVQPYILSAIEDLTADYNG